MGNHSKKGDFKPGDPRIKPGKKGRSGRPSNEFRDWCAKVIRDKRTREQAEGAVRNPESRHYASMFKALAEFGYGRAVQRVEIEGDVPRLEIFCDPTPVSAKIKTEDE